MLYLYLKAKYPLADDQKETSVSSRGYHVN